MDVLTIQCSNADSLVSNLRMTSPNWREAFSGEFAFRGQRDSTMRLVPRAFRSSGVQLGYSDDVIQAPCDDVETQARGEYLAVRDFLKLADAVGLPVPGDSQLFRGANEAAEELDRSFWKGTWPPSDILETLALAQHHGVPTRLLDFAYDPLVAAFFAVSDVMRHESELPKYSGEEVTAFAIWAVDLRFIRRAWEHGNDRIREITVPRAANPFLHAQSGLFLVDTGASEVWESGSCPTIEEVVCERAEFWDGREGFWSKFMSRDRLLPPVLKLEAPLDVARDVMLLLRREGLTEAHLMPSYDHVVEALESGRRLLGKG